MTPTRTTDPDVIEHRLLELAYTTDAKLTAPVLAYYANCSIEDAEKVLDSLAARDRLSLEVQEDGSVYYQLPDRQRLPQREPTRALEIVHPRLPVRHREVSPGLAALLSLIVPGAGQAYAGRWASALLWFLVVSAGYTLLFPGLILHLFNIVSAASAAQQVNAAYDLDPRPPPWGDRTPRPPAA